MKIMSILHSLHSTKNIKAAQNVASFWNSLTRISEQNNKRIASN